MSCSGLECSTRKTGDGPKALPYSRVAVCPALPWTISVLALKVQCSWNSLSLRQAGMIGHPHLHSAGAIEVWLWVAGPVLIQTQRTISKYDSGSRELRMPCRGNGCLTAYFPAHASNFLTSQRLHPARISIPGAIRDPWCGILAN